MLSFTPVNLANIFSETRSSQSSAQITVQEKRDGGGERTPVHKECINIKHMIEFSSPPKYIIVNRKNILMAAALGVHNDWLFLLGNLFSTC